MKEEYDFSNAEQGKFYIPIEEIELPIYLDKDILEFLSQKCQLTQINLQTLVNDLIRKDIEIARRVALWNLVNQYIYSVKEQKMLTTYDEFIPLISQLNHGDKLRLMQFLLTEFAREENISLEKTATDKTQPVDALQALANMANR